MSRPAAPAATIVYERVDLGTVHALSRSIVQPLGPHGPWVEHTGPLARHLHTPLLPVILVHGFGQNRRAWHLPSRSMANHLATQGFEVFNVDLPGHGLAHAAPVAPDWIRTAQDVLPAVLAHALDATGSSVAAVLGHSQGGLAACGLAGEHPAVVGVGALGCPFALGRGNPVLRGLAHTLHAAGRVAGRGTAFPMGLVRDLFRATPGVWESPWLPLPLRAWKPGSLEPSVRDEWLTLAFDCGRLGEVEHLLAPLPALARWTARRDCALLTIAGTHDLLAPPAVVGVGFAASQSDDKHAVVVQHGHGDLLIGRESRHTVWPHVVSWLHRLSASRAL